MSDQYVKLSDVLKQNTENASEELSSAIHFLSFIVFAACF